MVYFAHSKNFAGRRQKLEEHLKNVAMQAAQFAASIGSPDLAYYAGLLHDIGKFNPEFQRYLMDAESPHPTMKRGPDHKGAGAVLAAAMFLEPLAFLIKGHHGGLPAGEGLKAWLHDRRNDPLVRKAIGDAKNAIPELQTVPTNLMPTHIRTEHEAELFTRLLFSTLVDADFLDTERHFKAGRVSKRGRSPDTASLREQFEADQQQRFSECPRTPVNEMRAGVYQDCLRVAELEPGFFRLTVPTGGGKTRSSLAFALHHADKYGLERIIYAIPYMSITEQTAQEFRKIFPDEYAVLEHHSSVTVPEDPNNLSSREMWSRLAAENWNARLIVTTTVQLFESLMAHTPGACRKLHNIAHSVIILDEVQMLPTHLLTTILDVLRQLVTHYGATVVLCTATQPALNDRAGFQGLEGIREIVPNSEKLFAMLKRVQYQLPQPGEKWTWQQVADKIGEEHQVLAIVNTRADAIKLLGALDLPDDPSVFHLSTRMCGVHRRVTLEEVRRRLKVREACRLISTQVIEAGVDVDFPLVLRAIGPLDRIAQAAGRCNREGNLPSGRVIIFEPLEGGIPPGPYRIGTETTQFLLQNFDVDPGDPSIYRHYFEQYYSYLDCDECKIQDKRKAFDYPEVAQSFRMIADETTPVVVKYLDPQEPERVDRLLEELQQQPARIYDYLRSLQPYMVSLRQGELAYARQRGLAIEALPGLWKWLGKYDPVRGIVLDGMPDPENFIQ